MAVFTALERSPEAAAFRFGGKTEKFQNIVQLTQARARCIAAIVRDNALSPSCLMGHQALMIPLISDDADEPTSGTPFFRWHKRLSEQKLRFRSLPAWLTRGLDSRGC
jgi:hypothetical protein